jgi:hypothetical protein
MRGTGNLKSDEKMGSDPSHEAGLENGDVRVSREGSDPFFRPISNSPMLP